jgi:hypothetical protein
MDGKVSKKFNKDLHGSRHNLMMVQSQHSHRGMEEIYEKPVVSIASILAEI